MTARALYITLDTLRYLTVRIGDVVIWQTYLNWGKVICQKSSPPRVAIRDVPKTKVGVGGELNTANATQTRGR